MLQISLRPKFKKILLVKKDGKRFYFVNGYVMFGKKKIEVDLLFSYSPTINRVLSAIKTNALKQIEAM